MIAEVVGGGQAPHKLHFLAVWEAVYAYYTKCHQ